MWLEWHIMVQLCGLKITNDFEALFNKKRFYLLFGNKDSFHLFSDQNYLVKSLWFKLWTSFTYEVIYDCILVPALAVCWWLIIMSIFKCFWLCYSLLPSVYSKDLFVLALGSYVFFFLYYESSIWSYLFKALYTLLFLLVSVLMISSLGVMCCTPCCPHCPLTAELD